MSNCVNILRVAGFSYQAYAYGDKEKSLKISAKSVLIMAFYFGVKKLPMDRYLRMTRSTFPKNVPNLTISLIYSQSGVEPIPTWARKYIIDKFSRVLFVQHTLKTLSMKELNAREKYLSTLNRPSLLSRQVILRSFFSVFWDNEKIVKLFLGWVIQK